MDTASLVEIQIDDGRRLLEQLVRDGFDITGSFWLRFKFEEDGPWFYVVSKTVDQKGLQAAYRDVHDSIHRIPAPWGPWLSVSDISELKLVGTNDPLAREVLAFRDRYPGRNRFRGVSIGNYFLEDLYIYPPLTKSDGMDELHRTLTINIGTAAEPELIDLEKVPLVTIIQNSAGPSTVVFVGGGRPQRKLEGEEAQRFITQFDAIRTQLE